MEAMLTQTSEIKRMVSIRSTINTIFFKISCWVHPLNQNFEIYTILVRHHEPQLNDKYDKLDFYKIGVTNYMFFTFFLLQFSIVKRKLVCHISTEFVINRLRSEYGF